MTLDPDIHIVMHSVLSLKSGVTLAMTTHGLIGRLCSTWVQVLWKKFHTQESLGTKEAIHETAATPLSSAAGYVLEAHSWRSNNGLPENEHATALFFLILF